MACLPFYNVVTTRGENWLLEAVTVIFFSATYCYLAWGLVWACGGSLVGKQRLHFRLAAPSKSRVGTSILPKSSPGSLSHRKLHLGTLT
jgi:hypothetical protein